MGGETGDDPQPVSRSPLITSPAPSAPCSRRTTALLAAPLIVLTGASTVGNLLAPGLLTAHPLLLVALAPRTPFLAVAAGEVQFGAFVAVAFLRLCAADPSHFLLGRLHGGRATSALARRRRPGGSRRLQLPVVWERLGLVLVALAPSGKVLLVAGASRLPHRRVASAAVGGTLAQVVVLYGAGRVAAEPGRAMAETMAAWAPAVAVMTLVIAGVTAVGRRRSGRAGRSAGLAARPVGGPELEPAPVDLLE
jgi:hypothetical protein